QLLEIFFPAIDLLLLMRGRLVAELSVVARKTELLNQSKLRKQLRFAEDRFRKNFVVEKIETPGPKPDQVDQENRDDNDQDQDDGKEPLQDAFKHRTPCYQDAPDRAIGFRVLG